MKFDTHLVQRAPIYWHSYYNELHSNMFPKRTSYNTSLKNLLTNQFHGVKSSFRSRYLLSYSRISQQFTSLSWSTLIQFIPPHSISQICILILSSHLRRSLPSKLFLLAFLPRSYMHSFSPHACYMPFPFYPPWLDHYTCQRVQVMKSSPALYYCIPLRPKCSPQ
jgi:hypothetical protein